METMYTRPWVFGAGDQTSVSEHGSGMDLHLFLLVNDLNNTQWIKS